MDGAFAPTHVVIILLLFTVLFGAKRLPESARALGQALRIFKAETRALQAPAGHEAGAAPTEAAAPEGREPV